MPNPTENHEYNHPAKGTTNWHVPLNDNFAQFDTDIEIRDADANRGNYTPKQGAKFLATDTENVYVGDGSSWNEVASSGTNPSFEEVQATRLGLGRSPFSNTRITARLQSGQGAVVDAQTSSGENTATGVYAEASSSSGNTFGTYSVSRSPDGHGVFGVNFVESGSAIGVEGRNFSPDGVGVQGLNREGYGVRSVGDCKVEGTLEVTGTKNFTQTVDTDDGEKEVVYTATEAGTPHTEISGVARLEDGRAEVDLPEHFAWVTSEDEPLHVQITPHSVESDGRAAVERSRHRIVVADLDGEGAYEFSYTVSGTRNGHEDKEVVRDPR